MTKPRLSILIPFYRETPCNLISALLAESIMDIEIIAYDDGSQDQDLIKQCQELMKSHPQQVIFHFEPNNKGRSCARNALISLAQAPYVLFLDADMMPATSDFVAQWLDFMIKEKPAVCFGGFRIDVSNQDPATKVHIAMASHSDTKSAFERAQNPAKSIFTSNLLVRKDILALEPFDPEFTGWGWEDVEWGLRIAKSHGLHHVDIPAWHLGLDTVSNLLKKYDQSASNFLRILCKHPTEVKTYPSYQYANILSAIPLLSLWGWIVKQGAQWSFLPTRLRGFCLRLYRTLVYAKALK